MKNNPDSVNPVMPFPIRCFTCGKPLKNYQVYSKLLQKKSSDEALDKMGMRRECCRSRYKGYNPQLDEDILMYGSPRENRNVEIS